MSGNQLQDNSISAAQALAQRLVSFRKWLTDDAKAMVHPGISIVNGLATDGTKNAPVLEVGSPSGEVLEGSSNGKEGRLGAIDEEADRGLYERTTGCQVRATKELKVDEVIMTMPRAAIITPDLVASSDAGKAVLACCKAPVNKKGFWDAFENTSICESNHLSKISGNSGAQLLVKILQERKKGDALDLQSNKDGAYNLAEPGTISTRAPVLAFLIHQRFANEDSPPVASTRQSSIAQFLDIRESDDGNGLSHLKEIRCSPKSPKTFAPYARTLPASIPLPLCWKRSELALLAGCISGTPLLQDVAIKTMHLVAEYTTLVNAGILERFPETFSPGLLTWERWVWAAAVSSSRTLPSTCYFNEGDADASTFEPFDESEFQSPPEIWNELGVLVPLLDMLNHEAEAYQVTWQPCVPPSRDITEQIPDHEPHPPRGMVHRKVRKGAELYCCYGTLSNQNLILQYGFAQMNNTDDEVKMGWGLSDAVGGIVCPEDFEAISDSATMVYESSDQAALEAWWTEDRLALLEQEAFANTGDNFISELRAGKKMTATANCDGSYHPILLTVAVIATLPPSSVAHYIGGGGNITITKSHLLVLRNYLSFLFTRKLEKLLQNLGNGLKVHYNNLKLWTKASNGGLNYQPSEGNSDDSIGWHTFFETNAYTSAMEIEKRLYAVGTDTCVLTLYDGQLRALASSATGTRDSEKADKILKQLEELDFIVLNGKQGENATVDLSDRNVNGQQKGKENKKKSSKRKKNKKKNNSNPISANQAPALKLHIGNLSYATTPSDLFDYFASVYGKDNVLECHIPIERETNRSRGFGFVTMPERVALSALESGRKHEVDGRLLKIAKSNSASANSTGSKSPTFPPALPHQFPSDRCANCGYRPKYCTCIVPNVPGSDRISSGSRYNDRDLGYYGRDDRYQDDRYRERAPYYNDERDEAYRYSRDSRERSRYVEERSRSFERDDRYREIRRDKVARRSRERSRSYDYADDKGSRRGRESSRSYDYNEETGSRRSRERSLGHDYEDEKSSRRSRKSDDRDHENDRKRSRSRSRERSRKKKSRRRRRSHSPSSSSS